MKNNNYKAWSNQRYQQHHKDIKPSHSSSSKFLVILFPCFVVIVYLFYFYPLNLHLLSSSCSHTTSNRLATHNLTDTDDDNVVEKKLTTTLVTTSQTPTNLSHIVFGIAASSNLWDRRKDYIKIWWRPEQMRGFVWLDKPVKEMTNLSVSLPTIKISGDTSQFPYKHPRGHRSAIRISRIVSETFRLDLPDVRWFVMGDDDTIFFAENLVTVLDNYDHNQPYYIGAPSESHLQNIYFSYNMAYGGGGFAISRPLAESLAGFQDRCIRRYPSLYGSDDRIQACMAELGVPLTRHQGFHQYDVYGDLLGLLAAHPVAPLVSIHHLDVVQPIFPRAPSRAAAVRRLFDGPVQLDGAGIVQQSVCYEGSRQWTVSVSWGFVVMVMRGTMSAREMEMPARTFLNWYRRADFKAYAFNTRPVARNPCQKPYIYYLSTARYDDERDTTVTTYKLHGEARPACTWRSPEPAATVDEIVVYKKPDAEIWHRAPRRNCCRVLKSSNDGDRKMVIDVGLCQEGEIIEETQHSDK